MIFLESEVGRYDLARWQRDWHILQMMPGNHRLGCYLKTDSMPVGIVDFLEENPDDEKPWPGSLVIHRNYQRQGMGTEIFQAVTDQFRQERGWTVLRAAVKAQNEAGLAFLTHSGFVQVREGTGHFAQGIQSFFVVELRLS